MESELEKKEGSEKSISSNEDFEIIGSHAQISGNSISDDGKSNGPSVGLFKKHVVKRRVPISSHNLPRKRTVKSETSTYVSEIKDQEEHNESQRKNSCVCMLWKMLFIITVGIITFQVQLLLRHRKESAFDENKYRYELLEETVKKQQQVIEKLENQLKRGASSDFYTLPVRIDEERVTAFERKDGFDYFFVIVDWKRNDQGITRQHLHLAFKESNSSIYVYDHGSLSGKYFSVGDRVIDIDGIMFIKAADLRDQILWSHHNKDYFTSIIERPATEQAAYAVLSLLQPSLSSFSVLLSV